MNVFGFLGLMRSIYGKKLPDLEKIQNRGLLAVKIAQHFALRIDFLDELVCRHLAKLYRQTTPLPAEDAAALLKQYVSPGWFDEVQNMDSEPFASASVGQVHHARLKDGTRVIVKIIKKDFTKKFLRDLRSLRRLFRIALYFYPKLRKVFDPMGILDHIEDYTTSELDLRNEIKGKETLELLQKRYGDRYDLSRLRFPIFFPELSSTNVLVAEWVQGDTFDEMLDRGELSYELLLDLFNIHGFYLFKPGIFHGDIHPGNILLDQNHKICFVDTGALSQTSEKIRKGLFGFFKHLSRYDYEKCARCINDMADKSISDKQFDSFQEKFLDLYQDFADRTVSEVSLTKKMMDTIKLGVHSGMEFEKGMFSIIKSLMYLDGMVLRCKPDAVLLRDMRPFIQGFERIL